MFTQEERSIMDRSFFTMHIMTDSLFEFQSQNHDWWIIMEVEVYQTKREMKAILPKSHTYTVYHRHSGARGFHEHGQYACVLDAANQSPSPSAVHWPTTQ